QPHQRPASRTQGEGTRGQEQQAQEEGDVGTAHRHEVGQPGESHRLLIRRVHLAGVADEEAGEQRPPVVEWCELLHHPAPNRVPDGEVGRLRRGESFQAPHPDRGGVPRAPRPPDPTGGDTLDEHRLADHEIDVLAEVEQQDHPVALRQRVRTVTAGYRVGDQDRLDLDTTGRQRIGLCRSAEDGGENPDHRSRGHQWPRPRRRQGRVAHGTVIRSRRAASFASPIPGTSSRSSTVSKGPFRSRWATIRAASTGPTPGSASRSDALARLIEIGPLPPPGAPSFVAPEPSGPGTTIWAPADTGAARLIASAKAPARSPPAAATASATSASSGTETTPGEATQPATWTRIVPDGAETGIVTRPEGAGAGVFWTEPSQPPTTTAAPARLRPSFQVRSPTPR